jgi:hypothetical protein
MGRFILGYFAGLATLPVIYAVLAASPASTEVSAEYFVQRTNGEGFKLRRVGDYDAKSALSKEKWPFNKGSVTVYCGRGAITIVSDGTAYAALNGHTSGMSRSYAVQDNKGRWSDVAETGDNANFVRNGIARADAAPIEIGDWWGVLRKKALDTCGM